MLMPQNRVVLGFGANVAGKWGEPRQAIERALELLEAAGVYCAVKSGRYRTAPVGEIAQPDFINCVAAGVTALPPQALLALVKSIERQAGRAPVAPRWGARVLDIDILDYAGTVRGWDQPHDPQRPAELVLPHPLMHQRAFVLVPLAEIMPQWRHPVLQLTAGEMLVQLPEGASGIAAAD